MDMDEARIDADLGKLLQHIKEGQQNMSDQPGKCICPKELQLNVLKAYMYMFIKCSHHTYY